MINGALVGLDHALVTLRLKRLRACATQADRERFLALIESEDGPDIARLVREAWEEPQEQRT